MGQDYSYFRGRIPKCPHCGTEERMDDPLSDLYVDEAIVTIDCPKCENEYVVTVSVVPKYTSYVNEDALQDDAFGPQKAGAA